MSENGPEKTIIDCENEGRGFCFHSGKDSTAVDVEIENHLPSRIYTRFRSKSTSLMSRSAVDDVLALLVAFMDEMMYIVAGQMRDKEEPFPGS